MKHIIIALLIGSFSLKVGAQSLIFDHNDPIVTYDENNPPATPISGVPAKWVRTKRMNWNTDDFKAYYYNGMAFRLRYPENYDTSGNTEYPIIVMLTGRGEKGSVYDNELNLKHGARDHENDIKAGRFNGFLLFPQSSSGFWGDGYFASIHELLTQHFPAELPIDLDRVLLHGLSAGGQAVWNYISRYPKDIATALPMSAASPNYYSGIPSFKHIPIWLSQGGKDKAPTPFTSRALVDEIVSQGGNVRYTVYLNAGHGVWNTHYNESDFWPYLTRANKTIPIVMNGELTLVSTSSSRDVYEFITKNEICPGDPISVKLGITDGFDGYEWRKDGTVVPGANGNEYTASEFGIYDVRFLREGVWSDWSARSIEVKEKGTTQTPDIQVSGLASKVIPSPDGKDYVDLELPEGFIGYTWSAEGSNTVLSTDRVYRVSSTGSYVASVTEQFGCASSLSSPFNVIDANGLNPPANISIATGYAVSKTEIRLDWSLAAGDTPSTLELYKSDVTQDNFKLIALLGPGITSYQDSNLPANTQFHYIVRPVNETAAAETSDVISVTTELDETPPSAPTNLRVLSTNSSEITVLWDESTDDVGVFKYDVYRDGLKSTVVDGTTATLFGLTEEQTYRIQVKARDLTGNTSPFSNLVVTAPVASGVNYKYYHGTWNALPDFNNLTPVAIGNASNFDISSRTQDNNFAFYFEAEINIPVAGDYTLETRSDDGSKLYIGGYDESNLLVNNDGLHGMRYREGTYNFPSAGQYSMIVTFFEQGGGQGLEVYWKNTAHGVSSRQRIPDSAFEGSYELPINTVTSPDVVNATGTSYDQIQLTWNDNNSDEQGYQIFRSKSPSAVFSSVGTVSENETSYTDTNLDADTEYFYQIVGLGEFGPSEDPTPLVSEIGFINYGVAAQDNATGTGFILWSQENVFDRITSNKPISQNSHHLLAVKLINGSWYYDNNSNYYPFMPVSTDVLLAEVDFSNDIITSLENQLGDTVGIARGFTGPNDLDFFANRWNGGANNGEFTITGTYFDRSKPNSASAITLSLPAPPNSPTITTEALSVSSIELTWTKDESADDFTIYRSLNNQDFLPLITLSDTSFIDDGLTPHTEYHYFVEASNVGGETPSSVASTITLNTTPEVDELTDLTIRYNSLYELQLFATDVDSDALTITMGNAPAFTTFTDYGDGSALASFSPLEADQGVYDSLSVTVSDGFGGQVVQYFTLTINNNFAPDLSPISDINVVESQSVMVNLTASDVEGTENLLWSSDLPDFATLTPAIDGTATLEVAPDFIDGGVYAASVTVADPEGAENEQSFVINVAQKSPYTLVQVNFTDGSLLAPAGWNNTSGHPTQGDTYSNLVDIDGDATAIGVSIASNWTNNGSNNLGSNTGNDSGIFPDNVIQSAYWTGGNTESITVNGLNDANTYNLTFFGSREAGNDRTTRYTVGGQSVTLDAASNTSQTVSLNNLSPVSGEITFTVQRAAASAYGYINALVVEERFDTGLPPALPSNLTAAFDMNANEVNLSWTDRAFDEVGYRVYRSIDGGTTFTLLVELPENSVGFSDNQILPNTTFYYQVSPFNNNGENLTAPVEAVIPNVAPIIAAIADSSLQVGSSASIDISATDAPGDVITLGLATPYPFVTLTDLGDGNGQLNITPGVNDIGIYTLTITAVDQNQESSSESFELTIEASGTHHYYINFAGSTNFSAASPWNNYIGGGASGSTLNGIDAEENSFPTLSMTIQDSWNGFNSSGMTGSSLYPNQVTQTSLWTSGPQDKRFLISGLASNKAYDFTFFASRDGGGNRTTNYTINGTTVSLNASFNQDQTVTIEGIIPDSNGEILIIANKDASASYGYINAIVIEGYDAATIPAHPTELTATPLDEISIELNWKDNTNLETAYEVFRAENSDSNYSLVHAGAPNITTWTDQQTTPDVTYYYKVRAILDDASQTIFSNVSATSTIKATININFNVSDPQLTGGWNNTNSAPDPGLIFSNLQNSQGNNTGIAFEIVADNPAYDPSLYGFSGDNPFGENTGSDSGVVPDNVMRSTWWMDPNKTAELRFFNLDLSQKYKFTFFASRAGTGNRTSAYSINGTSVTLNAAGNTSQTVDINDVLPDQNGEILLSITSDAGALFSYIGAIIMQTSNTDPTKASNFARNEQTGFDQIENANGQAEIYPNPIQNGQMLTILLNDVLDDSNANARIMDSSGNVIISQRLLEPDNLIFDLDALTDGLYILQVTNGQSNTYHRIIKK